MKKDSPRTPNGESSVEARVYRAFGERTFLERDANVGYALEASMFDKWWLTWFWTKEELSDVDYRHAGLSLFLMADMVEAGDA